ncbi:MAG TPA: ribonuclease Y, partial [Firmicutes bacterium]|nr:ribonuclease Y [Bacillota bacterium]
MSTGYVILIAVITAVVAAAAGYYMRKQFAERTIGSAEQAAKTILQEAEKQAQAVKREKIIEAKEEVHKLRRDCLLYTSDAAD